MRIPSHMVVAGVLVAAVSVSVWASEQPPVAALPSRPIPQFLSGRTRQQQLMQQAQAAVERYLQRYPVQPPKVICGLTVLPADPKADASIRVRPPVTGVKPMIDRVTPQVCRGEGASQPVLPQRPR